MPAYIPVTSDQCLSESDKFLYNIWQKLAFGIMPIPPNFSPTNPPGRNALGWDVESTTNQLLYNIMLGIGGGGGGGSVTSVGTFSNSLKNNSAPNPIIGAGVIDFEVQVIPILRAQLIARTFAGTLLPGVTYFVTDPQFPLNTMYCLALDTNQLSAEMYGTTGGSNIDVIVGWDYVSDKITRIYCPNTNNETRRSTDNFANCIELFDTTYPTFRNCKLTNVSWFDDGTASANGLIADLNSTVVLLNGCNVVGSRVEAGCNIYVDGAYVYVNHFTNRADVQFIYSGVGPRQWDSLQWNSPQPVTTNSPLLYMVNDVSENGIQVFVPLDGDTIPIAYTIESEINVHINPAAPLNVLIIVFPASPMDGQILSIAATQPIGAFLAGLTINPNGSAISGNITAMDPLVSYTWIHLSGTWYFV